ncbi:MAG: recombinase zinc beta ribbon domain-containing protein [Dysgonamonadaceae bacterium]|nr:recombinase zinc beta ribbon domain-containing protein [Dysgonamonadaceae bacterium]
MNEKYKGDALLQKTYIADCITKKSKRNNGELPQYYVENNHPAIIERQMFDRVQEEIARRAGKRKVKEVGTKTEQGKYSSKYALTDLLFCGTCGTPYRRCTWSKKGKTKIVWRCISRLDYGTKYCKESPSIEESVIHDAVVKAITQKAMAEGANTDRILRHFQMYEASQDTDSIFAMRQKLNDITAQLDKLTKMDAEALQNGDFDKQLEAMYTEMYAIKDKIAERENEQKEIQAASDKLHETAQAIENIKGKVVEYDDKIVRQLIECIKVISINHLDIFFKDGPKNEMHI